MASESLTWVVAALLAFIVWFVTPSSYSAGGIRFTVHHTGSPGALTFVVRDSHGQPLPGVTVTSESFSGTTQEFTTDASGTATIRPGESEVLAVFIQGREFRFRPRGILEHFAPDCSGGLTLKVSIQNDRNAYKALVPASLSFMLSVTPTRHPFSRFAPAPAVGTA